MTYMFILKCALKVVEEIIKYSNISVTVGSLRGHHDFTMVLYASTSVLLGCDARHTQEKE